MLAVLIQKASQLWCTHGSHANDSGVGAPDAKVPGGEVKRRKFSPCSTFQAVLAGVGLCLPPGRPVLS